MSNRKRPENRIAVVRLSMPGSQHVTERSVMINPKGGPTRKIAGVVEAYARSRGVSPLAVDYEIAWRLAA